MYHKNMIKRWYALALTCIACGSAHPYEGWDGDPNYRVAGPGQGGVSVVEYVPGPFFRCSRYDYICANDPSGKFHAYNGERDQVGAVLRDPSACVSIRAVTHEPSECCTILGTCEVNKTLGLCGVGQVYVLNCEVTSDFAKQKSCSVIPNGGVPYPALCCAI
jgi:hypothetical protein